MIPERRSSRSISLRPSTFHTSAARAPAGSSATRSRSSSSRPATRYGSDGSASRLSPTASSAGRSAPASECTNSCPPVIPKRASATFASPPGSSSVHRPLRRSNSSSRRAPRRPTRTTARIPSPLIAQTSAAGPEVSMVDVPSRTSMRHATPSPVPAPKIVIPSWRPLGDHEPSVTAGALGARSWTWRAVRGDEPDAGALAPAGSELAGEPVAVGGPGHLLHVPRARRPRRLVGSGHHRLGDRGTVRGQRGHPGARAAVAVGDPGQHAAVRGGDGAGVRRGEQRRIVLGRQPVHPAPDEVGLGHHIARLRSTLRAEFGQVRSPSPAATSPAARPATARWSRGWSVRCSGPPAWPRASRCGPARAPLRRGP